MKYEFCNILGNEQIKKTLRRSVLEKSLSHAYLLNGAAGSGKKLLANSFARLIFCKTKKDGCMCHSCVQFDAQSHSDLYYVTRGERSKSIGVEAVRGAVAEVSKKPFEYEHKIFIIEEAELLTAEAQNALLRSIEEPPSYAVFILLAEKMSNILQTVRSRCFIYTMKPFGSADVYTHLKELGYSGDKSEIAGGYCGGSIGKAISICENEDFLEMRRLVNDTLSDCGSLEAVFSGMRQLEAFKDDKSFADNFILTSMLWFRDVLAYKATGERAAVYQSDYLAKIIKCADLISFKGLYLSVNDILELKRSLTANVSLNAALDAFTIKLGENK